MLLRFLDIDHPEAVLAVGRTVVGADPGATVSLPQSGLRSRHVAIEVHPQRGVSLSVLEPGAAVHVNGRPVGEFAFLRPGDLIALGNLRLELASSRPEIRPRQSGGAAPRPDTQNSGAASRVVLRGVSGKHFGRSLGLGAWPVVGSGPDADLRLDDAALAPSQARFELWPTAVVLRDLADSEGVRVNGRMVRETELRHGDQIVFDQHRFVLEAPGLPPPNSMRPPITGVQDAVPAGVAAAADPARDASVGASSGSTLWWLVGAAALIGLGFAALLL